MNPGARGTGLDLCLETLSMEDSHNYVNCLCGSGFLQTEVLVWLAHLGCLCVSLICWFVCIRHHHSCRQMQTAVAVSWQGWQHISVRRPALRIQGQNWGCDRKGGIYVVVVGSQRTHGTCVGLWKVGGISRRYTHTNTSTQMNSCSHKHVCTSVYTHTRISIHLYICTRTYKHAYICTNTHAYPCTHKHTPACTYTHTLVHWT